MPRALLISEDGDQIEISVVESENPTRSSQVTDNPVEKGVSKADHVKTNPLSFQISGIVSGTNAGDIYSKMVSFWQKSSILTFSGRNIITNLIIEDMPTIHDKDIANGFKFSLSMKQIQIASLKFVDLTKVAIPIRPKKKTGIKTVKAKDAAAALAQQVMLNLKAKQTTGGG